MTWVNIAAWRPFLGLWLLSMLECEFWPPVVVVVLWVCPDLHYPTREDRISNGCGIGSTARKGA